MVESFTCLTPWYKQSQKRRSVPRKVAWKMASNIPGIQLSTRNVNGKIGSEIERQLAYFQSYFIVYNY